MDSLIDMIVQKTYGKTHCVPYDCSLMYKSIMKVKQLVFDSGSMDFGQLDISFQNSTNLKIDYFNNEVKIT